jgi:hypothetical protein
MAPVLPYGTQGYTDPGTRRARFYDNNLSAYAKTSLWNTCPILEADSDPTLLFTINEQWGSYNAQATTGDYVLTQATTGSAAISTAEQGVLAIDSGSTTANQGANLQRIKSAFYPATGKAIWAEFRVKLVTSLSAQVFIGLCASDTTIIASGALSIVSAIGFSSITGDGVLLQNCTASSTTTTAAATTLVAGTYQNLGFYFNGSTVQFYVNGAPKGSAISANVPTGVALYPSLVCQSNGTTQPKLYSNGYRIVQQRN